MHSRRSEARASRSATAVSVALAVSVAVAAACAERAPVTEEFARVAASAEVALAASAAAATANGALLGAPPPLVTTPFVPGTPPAFCSARASAACELDVVDLLLETKVAHAGRKNAVTFIGWALDDKRRTVPPVLFVELAGQRTYHAAAVRLTRRPDVARVFKVPRYVSSGYDLRGGLWTVEPGSYRVNVLMIDAWGRTLRCDARRTLSVE